MEQTPSAVCVPLGSDESLLAGGKAAGLTRLIRAGLRVPEGFAVTGASPDSMPQDIGERYEAMGGGPVAVRSSSSGEDGDDFSHAGQYETVLDVRGAGQVRDAVIQCLRSLENARSAEYRSRFDGSVTAAMSVVVQRLVQAEKSGVIFTADPLSGDTGRMVINAVRGIGESLVGGTEPSDQYVCGRDGNPVERHLLQGEPVLKDDELAVIIKEAVAAERHFNRPLDLEWAIDGEGVLHWLQARPITTGDAAGINEFDTEVPDPSTMYTRCNIGEMLPGAATPLTISVFAEAIDFGLRDMYVYNGVIRKGDTCRFICSFYNHQFMNFSLMSRVAGSIAGATPQGLELNIIGRALEDRDRIPKKRFPLRLLNSIRYFRYIGRWKRSTKELEKAAATFSIDLSGDDPGAMYAQCDRNMGFLFRQYINHYVNSAYSGAMNGILMSVLAGGGEPTVAHFEQAASYLVNIPDIESADVVSSLEEIARSVASDREAAGRFIALAPSEAVEWLSDGPWGERFGGFLRRHGHRSIREAELREIEWAENREGLIATMQSLVRGALAGMGARVKGTGAALPEHPSRAFQWALGHARKGVAVREYSKSLVIKVQHQFKLAYRKIGVLLAEGGDIPDADLVYFFTHQELGALLSGQRRLIKKALRRRRLLAEQGSLNFPEICRGKPEPITAGQRDGDGVMKGIPVSRGIAEGTVRVVLTAEDAGRLEPGEIMVARFTDVGWTPFYGAAAGLVTEIGSALSHGAVVAREYGLPMVVNVAGATEILASGDRIRLNAYDGSVTRI